MKNLTAIIIIVLGGLMLLGCINTIITNLPEAAYENERMPGYLVGWCLGVIMFAFLAGWLLYVGIRRLRK